MTLNFPTEFRESTQFKRLVALLTEVPPPHRQAAATDIFAAVFQNLYNAASECVQPGILRLADVPILVADLAQSSNLSGDDVFLFANQAKLLIQDGEDFFCPMFERYNRAGKTDGSMQSIGGKTVAFQKRLNKASEKMLGDGLAIPKNVLVDEESNPLDEATTKRVQGLVVRCDLALAKQIHSSATYTVELVQNALTVVRKLSDEQIEGGCKLILKHRSTGKFSGHPALMGMTTEKLLPRFHELAIILEGAA